MSGVRKRGKHKAHRKLKNNAAAVPQDSTGETDDSLANISLEELQQLKKEGYDAFDKPKDKSSVDEICALV